MQIRLASTLQPDSIVDGEGIRTVIWTQGCAHACPGCQNPETWDFKGGFLVDVEDVKKEMDKLERNLGGIKEMKRLPGAIFIVDPKKERIAILEARKLNIPIVGLIDTNCNPEDVDYPIPGNDDAIRAVKLIADVMANAVIEGRQGEAMETTTPEKEEQEVKEEVKDMEQVVAEKE